MRGLQVHQSREQVVSTHFFVQILRQAVAVVPPILRRSVVLLVRVLRVAQAAAQVQSVAAVRSLAQEIRRADHRHKAIAAAPKQVHHLFLTVAAVVRVRRV